MAGDLDVHLRLDQVEATEETALLEGLITAARKRAEESLARSFIDTTWDWSIDRFPSGVGRGETKPVAGRSNLAGYARSFELPVAPVSSVTSISYYDTDGNLQTVNLSDVIVDTTQEPAVIFPADGFDWPSISARPGAVIVRFVAGYGAAATDVPEGIRLAIKHLCGVWYEYREAVADFKALPVPMTAEFLLDPYRWMVYQ